jgi:hypothetical protein
VCLAVAFFAIVTTLTMRASAEPIRILLAVSHTRGAEGELPLHHSADDARHVRDALSQLGGFRDPILLTDPTPGELAAGFDRARALAQGHTPEETTFVFYFSGHGDRDRIHLGTQAVPISDVASRVRGVPAGLYLLVTDACRNYPGRTKGIASAPMFQVAHDEKNAATGVVWFFAAGEGEAAQESDELDGALFTHFWVSGLRGAADANGDGNVTLAESYDFAYAQTLYRSARATGVLQRPEAVFDVREVAPAILTHTDAAGAVLKFPKVIDAHYLVYSQGARAIAGEIWGAEDHAATMVVPPGRYVVQRRGAGGSGAVELALAQGQERVIRAADFRAFPEEQLAQKGGAIDFRPNELRADFEMGLSRLTDLGESGRLSYARMFDAWGLSIAAGGGYGTQTTSIENVHITHISTDVLGLRRLALGPTELRFGLGFEGAYVWQRLTRADASRVGAAGYQTNEDHKGFLPGGVAEITFRVPLGATFFLDALARGTLLFANLQGSSGPIWGASAGLGAGARF